MCTRQRKAEKFRSTETCFSEKQNLYRSEAHVRNSATAEQTLPTLLHADDLQIQLETPGKAKPKVQSFILSRKKGRFLLWFLLLRLLRQFHVWPVICFYLWRLTAVSLYNLVFHTNDHTS